MKFKLLYISLILFGLLLGPSLNLGYSLASGADDAAEQTGGPDETGSASRGSRYTSESEPNDAFNSATTVVISPLLSEETYYGDFKSDTDVDYFKMLCVNGDPTGFAPSEIIVELDGQFITNNQVYMEVFDPDQHFIARSEEAMTLRTFTFLAPSNGYFYFVVHQTGIGTSGTYDLKFSNMTIWETNDLYDGDNNFTQARLIPDIVTPGAKNQSYIHCYNDTYDIWKFKGLTGMNLTVNVTMDLIVDLDVYLYDSFNTLLGSSAHTGFAKPEQIQIDQLLLTDDFYAYVVARRWPMAQPGAGSYNISVYGSMEPHWNFSLPDNIELQEDDGVKHIGMDRLFIEYNKKSMDYQIWNYTIGDWDTSFYTNNMSVRINQNTSIEYALEIKLKKDRYGIDQVRYRAEHEDGWIVTRTNNITVMEVNDAPGLDETNAWPVSGGTTNSAPDKITGTQNIELNFTVTASDVDLGNAPPFTDHLNFSATLNYTGTSKLTELPFTIDLVTGKVAFVPTNDAVGTFLVNFSVNDNPLQQTNINDWRHVTFEITDANDPPEMVPVNTLYVNEDSWLNKSFSSTDIDALDTPTYKTNLTDVMVSGQFNFGTDGLLSFLPDNDDVGTHHINVTVMDIALEEDTIDVKIIVNNTNDVPVAVISTPSEGAIIEAGKELVTLDASKSYDVDGDLLSYSWYSNLDFDLGTGKNLGVYLMNTGEHKVTLTVKDPSQAVSLAVVNVTVVNVKPPDNGVIPKPTLNLTLPLDGAMLNKNETDLRWITSSIYVLDLKYDVYLYKSTESRGEPYKENVTGQSVHVTGLQDMTGYKWEVIPKYGLVEGICWNGPWSFDVNLSFIPQYGVVLQFDETITMKANEAKSFNITVKNMGNTIDKFDVEISSENKNLVATFEESRTKITISIAKGGQTNIIFFLTTAVNIVKGDYSITFKAISTGDITERETLEVPVTVEAGPDGDGKDGKDGDDKAGESNTLLYIILVVVVAVVLVVVFFIFQRKRKAEEASGPEEVPGMRVGAAAQTQPNGMPQPPYQQPGEPMPQPAEIPPDQFPEPVQEPPSEPPAAEQPVTTPDQVPDQAAAEASPAIAAPAEAVPADPAPRAEPPPETQLAETSAAEAGPTSEQAEADSTESDKPAEPAKTEGQQE